MLQNYFKIAWRNLIKNKGITLIQVLGLTLGVAVSLVIVQYVMFEKSYDRFHTKSERIFRIALDFYNEGKLIDKDAMNYPLTGPVMAQDFPEVIAYTRITPEYDKVILKLGDAIFEETKVFYADPSFFDLFDYSFIQGQPTQALKGHNKVVLTQALAEKYFGPKTKWAVSPVGQTIRFNNVKDLIVSGIIEDGPKATHLKFNALISFDTFVSENPYIKNNWGWNDFITYVLTVPGTTKVALQSKMTAFANTYKEKNHGNVFVIQPLTDIHLHSHQSDELEPGRNNDIVNALGIIALIIISMAWINYINLSTSIAEKRAKEIGVRKAIGAGRITLVCQFLTETFLMNLIAVISAVCIAYVLLPYLGALLYIPLTFTLIAQPLFWLALLVLVCLGTLLSGFYPAFVLSSFRPMDVLKEASIKIYSRNFLRKGLITFQFAIAIILIVGTITVHQQINYMQRKSLGFELEKKVVINAPGIDYDTSTYQHKYKVFKNALEQISGVGLTTASSSVPGGNLEFEVAVTGVRLEGTSKKAQRRVWAFSVDEAFIDTYALKLIAGRTFSPNDTEKIIINKSAVKHLGAPTVDAIIGKKIQGSGQEIIGVVEDYHHQSLQHEFLPMLMVKNFDNLLYYTVNIEPSSPTHVQSVLERIKTAWKDVYPKNPFTYTFLEDRYNNQYQSDIQLFKAFSWFSFLALFITGLGLLGLSSYIVINRTKEIGVRKVMGASIRHIMFLLSKNYLFLLGLASLPAIALAFYMSNRWLEGFVWRIELELWLFVVPILIVGGIALLVVNVISFKAAVNNPIKSLRTE